MLNKKTEDNSHNPDFTLKPSKGVGSMFDKICFQGLQ